MATLEHARLSGWRDRLLPDIVDHLAHVTPEALFAEYAAFPSGSKHDYRGVSYRELAHGVNGIAAWMQHTLGSPSRPFEVLAYDGGHNVECVASILAAVKAGYVLWIMGDNVVGHPDLFQRLQCDKILGRPRHAWDTTATLNGRGIVHYELPTTDDLLNGSYSYFPYMKFPGGSEPLMIVQTAGTTGTPKLVTWTHDMATRSIHMLAKPGDQTLHQRLQGRRVLCLHPHDHIASLSSYIFSALPFGTIVISGYPWITPSACALVTACKHTKVDVALVPPSVVEELGEDDSSLEYCAQNLEHLIYTGGPVRQTAGDRVSTKMPLFCQYGASEFGLAPQTLPDMPRNQDWSYLTVASSLGHRFEEVVGDCHELCIQSNKGDEYRTRDLFQQHPELPGLWTWQARVDDLVVLAGNTALNPIPMERQILAAAEEAQKVFVVGSDHMRPALLVVLNYQVPSSTAADLSAAKEKLWPIVQQANLQLPPYAQIDKNLILLIGYSQNSLRLCHGHGQLSRARVPELYSQHIERLYRKSGLEPGHEYVTPKLTLEQMTHLVRTAVTHISADVTGNNDDDENDLLARVGDPLRIFRLARNLREALSLPVVTLETIRDSRSVSQLSQTLYSLQGRSEEILKTNQEVHAQLIETVLAEYQSMVHRITPCDWVEEYQQRRSNFVVIMGSTGMFERYMIDEFLQWKGVKIYYLLPRTETECVDRCPWGEAVTVLNYDPAAEHFGLSADVYTILCEQAMLILNNMWSDSVQGNLDSFRPHLAGLVNIFRLVSDAKLCPYVFDMSSMDAIACYPMEDALDEGMIEDHNAPLPTGFAQSRYIAERLCDYASKVLQINCRGVRLQQLVGPVERDGAWRMEDWFSSLVLASLRLGALPDSLGQCSKLVAWTPVDFLCMSIRRMMTGRRVRLARPLPRDVSYSEWLEDHEPTTWGVLVSIIQRVVLDSVHKQLEIIMFDEWLEKLQVDYDRQGSSKQLVQFLSAGLYDCEAAVTAAQDWVAPSNAGDEDTIAGKEKALRRWVAGWLSL